MGGGSNDSQKVSFRDQILTILKFRRGELNCVFATSVAEEGLDIPDCNAIIRFDLYDTLIQYIQSRGRARQDGSEYLHMVERYNALHQHKVAVIKTHEEALRKFCEAMPEDRKLTGNDYNMEYFLQKDKGQRQYTVPETGAKLNYRRSLVCLASFVSSLPHPPETALTPEYVVSPVDGGFHCEVILPSVSPIRNAVGRVHSSKAVAKCSAAFEMCLELVKAKYLDENLRPVFTKQLPLMGNARLAVSSHKSKEYDMRVKPEMWSILGEPAELYAMALTLGNPMALGRPSVPLLLLSRHPIPQIAPFPLFFGTDRSSQARCIPVPGTLKIDANRLQGLATFTLRIFDDIFSKEYDASAAELPYFLAPTSTDHAFSFSSANGVDDIVAWKTIDHIQCNSSVTYEFNEPDEFFKGKFLSDPWDGSRKFYLLSRRHDLKPTDPVPEGVVAPKRRAWMKTCEPHDILNYSVSLWSKSRSRITFRDDQPVVEAELLPIRRNILDKNLADEDMNPKRCFLILEPMRISTVSLD